MFCKHEIEYAKKYATGWVMITGAPDPIIRQFYIDTSEASFFDGDIQLQLEYDPRCISDAESKRFMFDPDSKKKSGTYIEYEWTFS